MQHSPAAAASNRTHLNATAMPLPPRSCINVLLELIQTKVNYVVQESIIVIKDIFRYCLVPGVGRCWVGVHGSWTGAR